MGQKLNCQKIEWHKIILPKKKKMKINVAKIYIGIKVNAKELI